MNRGRRRPDTHGLDRAPRHRRATMSSEWPRAEGTLLLCFGFRFPCVAGRAFCMPPSACCG
eukprot:6442174-Pyramimonas_sp.AAC.1